MLFLKKLKNSKELFRLPIYQSANVFTNSKHVKENTSNKYLDPKVLKEGGNKVFDIIAETYDHFEDYKVKPNIRPGQLRAKIPELPPMKGEDLNVLLKETQDFIIPSMTHWQHPKFFGYFPCTISHHAIIAELFAMGFSNPGFTWICSPANTEIENAMMDWCVKMLGLPEYFLLKNTGGGMIANTIGDALFLSVNAAKYKKMKSLNLELNSPEVLKFVGYFSEHSHTQNLKALMLKDVHYKRAIPVKMCPITKNFLMDIKAFEQMIEEDINNGLIPFWFGATFGTTSTLAIDPIGDIRKICRKHDIWLSIDAAFLGSSLICSTYQQQYCKDFEGIDSIVINFGKNILAGMTSALLFVKDKVLYSESLGGKTSSLYLNPEYLKNEFTDEHDVVDYKDWQVGLGRRFSGLKLWFLIRGLGIEGLQSFIEKGNELGILFEKRLKANDSFEMVCKRELGLVCFRAIKDGKGNLIPEKDLKKYNVMLNEMINESGEYLMVPSEVNGIYFLRFSASNSRSEEKHVEECWEYIVKMHKDLVDI